MIALGGVSRFPIFFRGDGRKSIGLVSENNHFNHYVQMLRGSFVAIESLQDVTFTSRFVINRKAINPSLEMAENIPHNLYIYPEEEPTEFLKDVLAIGFTLKGGRQGTFVPLLSKRLLTKQELNAILHIAEVYAIGIDRVKTFLTELGIAFQIERELPQDRFVLALNDPQTKMYDIDDDDDYEDRRSRRNISYRVLVDKDGRVLNLDFCCSGYQGWFLPELVMFVRESGSVNHIGGFHY